MDSASMDAIKRCDANMGMEIRNRSRSLIDHIIVRLDPESAHVLKLPEAPVPHHPIVHLP